MPGGAGVTEWTETVAAAAVVATDRIGVFLAPADDADENDPEMLDLLTLVARPDNGTIKFTASFSERTSGPIKLLWKVL